MSYKIRVEFLGERKESEVVRVSRVPVVSDYLDYDDRSLVVKTVFLKVNPVEGAPVAIVRVM